MRKRNILLFTNMERLTLQKLINDQIKTEMPPKSSLSLKKRIDLKWKWYSHPCSQKQIFYGLGPVRKAWPVHLQTWKVIHQWAKPVTALGVSKLAVRICVDLKVLMNADVIDGALKRSSNEFQSLSVRGQKEYLYESVLAETAMKARSSSDDLVSLSCCRSCVIWRLTSFSSM